MGRLFSYSSIRRYLGQAMLTTSIARSSWWFQFDSWPLGPAVRCGLEAGQEEPIALRQRRTGLIDHVLPLASTSPSMTPSWPHKRPRITPPPMAASSTFGFAVSESRGASSRIVKGERCSLRWANVVLAVGAAWSFVNAFGLGGNEGRGPKTRVLYFVDNASSSHDIWTRRT